MDVLLLVVILLVCVLLAFVVLIQNPKGGGLAGNIGGVGNQMMGVKRTTEGLEKVTWYLVGILFVTTILYTKSLSSVSKSSTKEADRKRKEISNNKTSSPVAQPQNTTTLPVAQPTQQPVQK